MSMTAARHTIVKNIAAILLIGMLLLPLQTHAQRAVTVVSDRSQTAVQSTLSAASDAITSAATQALNIKEFQLDGIAYGITRTIIQSMVRSIVNWINSGFQGSPAFVTDLENHLQSVADQVVSDTLLGSELALLCSPFELDVRVALATNYNQQQRDGYQPQCTLDDVTGNMENFLQGSFEDGGWASWFELTQGESNDPNRAYFEASMQLDAAIRNAQGEEIQLLEFGDGFLSFRVCSDTQAQSGAQSNCTITTPGRVIADQLNGALGAGRDQLITADEINEIIGALMAQLAQQALTGAYGLLGLGGNSSYTQYGYGSDGTSSYLDALAEESPMNTGLATSTREVALRDAIARTNDYLDAQYEIVSRVNAAKSNFDSRRAALAADSCSAPSWPNSLETARDDAQATIDRYVIVVAALEELRSRYLASNDPSEQSAIMEEYLALERDGFLVTTIDITEAELFIEFDLRDDIAALNSDLAAAEARCRPDND